MILKNFQGKKLSALGFGAMRLPVIVSAMKINHLLCRCVPKKL